ncbi:MAG: hypothetical protein IJX30_01220 [Clostridia bacterium]|nr:hypothetical protein [Clostridia bacterium]
MRFRNSLRLLMENFKYVYKMLLYKCIIGLIAIALCCAFILPELSKFWNSEQVQLLIKNGKEFLKAFVALHKEGMEIAKDSILGDSGSLAGVISLLSTMTTEIVLMMVGVILVYLVRRLADTVCHFTTGALLNDRMATYAETPFATSAVSNLGKALLYSIVYVPLIFLFDVIMILLCGLILTHTPILLGIPAAITLLVAMQAFKLSKTAYWMPAMTNGATLKQAMGSQGKEARSQGWTVFAFYVVCVYFVIIINVIAAVCTFGSALIVTLPSSYFFFICAQYVCYYTIKGKKYFITYDKIADNPTCGDCSKLISYIEEKKTEEIAPTDSEKQEEK